MCVCVRLALLVWCFIIFPLLLGSIESMFPTTIYQFSQVMGSLWSVLCSNINTEHYLLCEVCMHELYPGYMAVMFASVLVVQEFKEWVSVFCTWCM